MDKFYRTPQAPERRLSAPIGSYFSKYEETHQGNSIFISARLMSLHKDVTDRDLWLICFGGLRLDRFEVKRHGLRVEIMGKMRDLKEIRKSIEEDRKMGIFR